MALSMVNPNKHWENAHYSFNSSLKASIILMPIGKVLREMETTDQYLCYIHSCELSEIIAATFSHIVKGLFTKARWNILRLQRWYNIDKMMENKI